LFVIK